MAKLTKEEQRQLQQAAREKEWADFKLTFHERLTSAMFEWMTTGPGYWVKRDQTRAGVYVFIKNAGHYAYETPLYSPGEVYDSELIENMESVESALRQYAEEQERERLHYEAVQAARNKLTPEERELLGVA